MSPLTNMLLGMGAGLCVGLLIGWRYIASPRSGKRLRELIAVTAVFTAVAVTVIIALLRS